MKTLKLLSIIALISMFSMSCSNDDERPEIVNEEEVITTITITLIPQGGGTNITLQSQDLDGDGPNAPVVTVSGDLASFTNYDGTVVLLNETENPAENITEEVEEEAEEHQFFYTTTGGISDVTYTDMDANGNPVGITFLLIAQQPGAASLSVTLRHEPIKPNDGTPDNAGGETDIAQTFNFTIQ